MSERRLILSVTAKDCDVQTFRCGGNGGQNVNKVETGVRYVHRPSGARGQSCDERSQLQNRRIAWRRMVATKEFQLWLKKQLGQDAVVEAEALRRARNATPAVIPAEELLWECRRNGRWETCDG